MTQIHHDIRIFINHNLFTFREHEQAGREIKQRGGVPADHLLCLDPRGRHAHEECSCERQSLGNELTVVADDQMVRLEDQQHFWSVAPAAFGVTVTIDKKPYEFADSHQTGRSLKERAGIPLTDVLFLDRPHEDDVIANDTKVMLACGDCFHSAPPANYGSPPISAKEVGFCRFESLPQPGGWTFLVVRNYPLPVGLSPAAADLLVKLPPTFPDAAPDMFWMNPQVRTPTGGAPQGTTPEPLLGASWQRFSWHLRPGAWRPGVSTLRDFMRCVRARLEKRN